jgi:hypothetical protein
MCFILKFYLETQYGGLLFLIKQSCPARTVTMQQAPPRGGGMENCGASYSYDLPALFQKVRRHVVLPDKTTK